MKYLFFLILTFFVSCTSNTPVKNENVRPQSGYVYEIRTKAAKKLQQDYHLVPSGSGSQMMDKVKMLALSFRYYSCANVIKARELLIAATDELMKCVNEDEQIRPYLADYPFKPINVEIRIFLYKKNGESLPAGELVVLSSINGIFTYEIDGVPRNSPFVTVLEETYEEAVAKQVGNG